MKEIGNFIHGKSVGPLSGKWIPKSNPATGEVLCQIARSEASDVHHAVDVACGAQKIWAEKSQRERSDVLKRIAQKILERREEFSLAETNDTGKPITVSRRVDIPRAALNFEFFSEAINQFGTHTFQPRRDTVHTVLAQPLGVVGCISPWNLPLYLLTWKIAPALAAGNAVIAKPSEVTPTTASMLAEVAIEAGLPPGVLNVIQGLGAEAGSALVREPRVKAISFTGSTQTGRTISELASPMFKKLALEMGGKNPFIVFEDADLDWAATEAVRAAFSNQGQICLCGSRVFVQKKIYSEFRGLVLEKTKGMQPGDPLVESTVFGSLVSESHGQKVLSYLEIARAEGAHFLSGGKRVEIPGRCKNGIFIPPTWLEGLGNHCRTNQEEIFGPVATLGSFETETEALELANGTPYGLAATIFTRDLDRTHRFSANLQAGVVWINTWMDRDLRTPFGGVKQSGFGKEGGMDALRFFMEEKSVTVKFFERAKE